MEGMDHNEALDPYQIPGSSSATESSLSIKERSLPDEWEINPININVGKLIGHGFWGKVHRCLVRSHAIRKLDSVIPESVKDQYMFAAIKVLKG